MIGDLSALPERAAYDVIVLGSGGAGLAAALFAAIGGRSVLVVERTEFVGGTTALSGATIWVPNTHHSEPGLDTPEQAERFLDLAVGNHSRSEMRRAFLAAGPEAVREIEDQSDVKLRAYALHPDYIQEVEGATMRGRALEPVPFDGRMLGDWFQHVRPPIPEFTLFGKLMIDRVDIGHLLKMKESLASFRHAASLFARYALDRLGWARGTRLTMGNALIGRLLLSLRRRGADVALRTSATELLRDADGRVTGVALEGGGVTRRVEARLGVVLATGGFGRHPERRATMLHAPMPTHSPAAPGHTGAAHDLALAIGARYGEGGMDNAFWAPVSTRLRPDGSTAVFPHFVMDRSKPGTVCVDGTGRRFVNESTSYHLFARAMFEANRERPAIPAYIVTDAEGLRKYGLGMVRMAGADKRPYLADGYLKEAPTLRALADTLGIDADNLEATVASMNRYAETGTDPEFGRGATPYHRANGDATAGLPNPTLGPIRTAPFYAVTLYPGDIGAATGLATDTDAQVLDQDDRPIGGLYAVGNDMQSIMGGTYPAPGITLGPGIVFAYRAMRHALAGAAQERRAA